MTLVQAVPLIWQIIQQMRSLCKVKKLHKDYQDFKSVFDETQILLSQGTDASRLGAAPSVDQLATGRSGGEPRRKGKSNARSRKEVVEVA